MISISVPVLVITIYLLQCTIVLVSLYTHVLNYIIINVWSVWSHVCSVLVWRVSRYLHHNVIAGSTRELYTCHLRHMARFLLKRSDQFVYIHWIFIVYSIITL